MDVTPFRLTYEHDMVLPVKIYLQSIMIQRQSEISFEHLLEYDVG